MELWKALSSPKKLAYPALNNMTTKTILAIESSCDDTSVAIVSSNKEILANFTLSQHKEHQLYQGVVPEIAARAHMNNIAKLIKQALAKTNIPLTKLDAIASTGGPGLIGGVIVGTIIAKAIAASLNKPFIAINHLEGHALTARLSHDIPYPYLLLLVSGGHCQFVEILGLGNYRILGQTLDDAVGEAFDKTAKMLNLGYPGGPIIEKLAKEGNPDAFSLPLPLMNRDSCDLSFSGLKTAVKELIKISAPLSTSQIQDLCASFQKTIGQTLCTKSIKAINIFNKSFGNLITDKNFVLSGGVAANLYLRQKLQEAAHNLGFSFTAPPIKLCTDNAAMIAWAALERLMIGYNTDLDFCPRACWPLNELQIK